MRIFFQKPFFIFFALNFFSLFALAQTTQTGSSPKQEVISQISICSTSLREYFSAESARRQLCRDSSNITNCEDQITECRSKLVNIFPVNLNEGATVDQAQIDSYGNDCRGLLGSLKEKGTSFRSRLSKLQNEKKEERDKARTELRGIRTARNDRVEALQKEIEALQNGENSISDIETKLQELQGDTEERATQIKYQKSLSEINAKMEKAKSDMEKAEDAYLNAKNEIHSKCDEYASGKAEQIHNQRKFKTARQSGGTTKTRIKLALLKRCLNKNQNKFQNGFNDRKYERALRSFNVALQSLVRLQQTQSEEFELAMQNISEKKMEEASRLNNLRNEKLVTLARKLKEIDQLQRESDEETQAERRLSEASDSLEETKTLASNLTFNIPNVSDSNADVNAILTDVEFDNKKTDTLNVCCDDDRGLKDSISGSAPAQAERFCSTNTQNRGAEIATPSTEGTSLEPNSVGTDGVQ